jgi:cytochrome c oxidase assembly protein subunit 15
MNIYLHRFAVLTACCTLLLLIAGALVTSNDAGDSVPDWPLSYGSLLPPMVGNIIYEQSHRYAAATVGLLTLALAAWIAAAEKRAWVKWTGWAALAGVVAQAGLGGLRVLNPGHSMPISIVHAGVAQLFLCTVVALCVFTSRWWMSDSRPMDAPDSKLRGLAWATFVFTFVQLLLGATFRHFRGEFNPHLVIAPHVLNAFAVLGMTMVTGRAIRLRHAGVAALRRPAVFLSALVGTQMLLGMIAYMTVLANRQAPQPLGLMVWATVMHLVLGAVVLAVSVVLALVAHRLLKPAASTAEAAERAAA